MGHPSGGQPGTPSARPERADGPGIVRLDVRGIEPPRPMAAVLEALDGLGPGQTLEILHDRRPILLYPLLEARGFAHDTDEPASGLVRIVVRRPGARQGALPDAPAPRMAGAFDRAPFIVIWETTRACALACVHCRAQAMPRRDPGELTTDEGRRLMDTVREFGDPPPLMVLTGGDPLRRPDIVPLVAHGHARGLSVSLTPSGTAAVTEPRLRALRDAGLARLAVSVDGAGPEAHDAFRRVRGSHRFTMQILERARGLGLPLQINTTVSRQTAADLPALARQMEDLGIVLWALFFLIPVGRAHAGQALSAQEIEDVLVWAAGLATRVPFGVKTTEAPQYHRVLAERHGVLAQRHGVLAQRHGVLAQRYGVLAERHGGLAERRRGASARPDLVPRAGRAVTDGNGFVFVDHRGEICPSGFLPTPAGNVRRDSLVTVYREAPLFLALRDPSRLGGRCGRCEYRERCGGSRARAMAATGDPLAEDPGCPYQPAPASPAPRA